MGPQKMTITEAKKIDLVNHLASRGWQTKKVSVIFSFHQQPSTSYVKETPKILIKEVRELESDRLKITWKAAAYLLKQRGIPAGEKKKHKSTKNLLTKKIKLKSDETISI